MNCIGATAHGYMKPTPSRLFLNSRAPQLPPGNSASPSPGSKTFPRAGYSDVHKPYNLLRLAREMRNSNCASASFHVTSQNTSNTSFSSPMARFFHVKRRPLMIFSQTPCATSRLVNLMAGRLSFAGAPYSGSSTTPSPFFFCFAMSNLRNSRIHKPAYSGRVSKKRVPVVLSTNPLRAKPSDASAKTRRASFVSI